MVLIGWLFVQLHIWAGSNVLRKRRRARPSKLVRSTETPLHRYVGPFHNDTYWQRGRSACYVESISALYYEIYARRAINIPHLYRFNWIYFWKSHLFFVSMAIFMVTKMRPVKFHKSSPPTNCCDYTNHRANLFFETTRVLSTFLLVLLIEANVQCYFYFLLYIPLFLNWPVPMTRPDLHFETTQSFSNHSFSTFTWTSLEM